MLKILIKILAGFGLFVLPYTAFASALVHLNDASATPGASTYTLSAATFGTASSDRLIVVSINYIGGVVANTDVTATIGGVSATNVSAVVNTGEAIASYIFVAAVPTGTSGNIVFSNSQGNFTRTITSWYGLTGYNVIPFDHQTAQGSSGTQSVTIATAANGAVLGASANQGGTGANTVTWTGITSDFSANPAGNTAGANGSKTFVSSSGGTAVQAVWTPNSTNATTLAVVSFQPSAVTGIPTFVTQVLRFWGWW